MPEHDPLNFITSLGTKLATRSRHVCAFLGAGASRACGLPDVPELQRRVLNKLIEADQKALGAQLSGRNLEQALSRLRRIAALLSDKQTIDGLTAAEAVSLDKSICKAIVGELDIANANLAPAVMFAAWIARSKYHLPIELFTINYDLILESALETLGVPYFDGFIGVLKARFQTELVEAVPGRDREVVPSYFVRLWKLHGSVNWTWEKEQHVIRLGAPAASDDHVAAIYPSDAKYEESRRVPFVVLQDRLRRSLHENETLTIITGYSFGDDHLNEMIFDAALRCERSEFVVFCYSTIPEVLAKKAALTPNIQVVTGKEAILSGQRAGWRLNPNLPDGLWIDEQFALRDFKCLAEYLAKSVRQDSSDSNKLSELLALLTKTPEPATPLEPKEQPKPNA
jgi:hypothetical protein